MNNNELSSLSLAERRRLLELAKSAKLPRQSARKTEITPQSRDNGVPLSWSQQRLWFLAQLDPAAQTAYHMSIGLNLKGQLNRDALQAALDTIVARHEIMRTTISTSTETLGAKDVETVEDEAQQLIGSKDCRFSLIQEDLRQLFSEQKENPEALQAAIENAAYLEATRPFDFTHGPLARGRLLTLAEDQHILLLTQHHIISDGWSVNLLMHELSTLYHAFSQGLPDPLPALPVQYADYVIWQRSGPQRKVLEKQIDFWRHTLQEAPAVLELPTDRPRPAKQSYAGDRIKLAFPPALYAGLKNLSQRHGTTLFMTLLAGWSTLLSRLSGQDDIVTGTPIANRRQPELASLMGFFANTLALRVQLHTNPTVSELLAQVRKQSIDAFSHQDLPFEQLVEILKPSRSLSHSPIFQVMLSLENLPGQRQFELPGLRLEERPAIRESAYFDLTLTLNEIENGLAGELEYARDLFDHATIERMVSHLYTLLAAMVADDTQRVTELPLMTPQQRQQLLVDFNHTALPCPQDKLIHQLLEQQADCQPDAIALVWQDIQFSYAELNRRANQLAHYLIASGVRPDDRVAICADRSPDMIIGMYGILKAGAGYVPLDPEYPAERLRYQLTDSNPALLLTQPHLQDKLAIHAVPVFLLDDDTRRNTLARQPDHNPDAGQWGLQPHHLAYIIYTSGSTGQPKGVMLEHRNVVSFIHAQHHISAPQPGDRILQFATMAFDTSVSDIFPTLAAGATLVLRPPHLRVPDAAFVAYLTQQQITVIDLPTAFWHHWGQEMKAGRVGFSPHLRTLIVGGEKAEFRHLTEWQALPDTRACRWINTYGPTEATVIATHLTLDNRPYPVPGIVPIGRPNANTRIYILDPHGQPVPPGVSGEIHIGGAGVARGYLHQPALTAEKFIADPFSDQAGARMYKSGDLGRWLPDGNIDYLGRNDFQVKIRGFRIEPGEIEAQLAACDGVQDAVVVAREGDNGDKRLIAYLIPQPGAVLTPVRLREQLSACLMEHMLPGAFVMLAAFPLTASGKLDRRALPAPDSTALASHAYEAPQGEMEQVLAALWQSLLGLEQVGRHDNFFALGGHSLLTVQVAARLRQQHHLQVELQDLFTWPVLSELARALDANRSPAQPAIRPARRDQPLPLSSAQQRLWFLAQLDPAAQTAYHIAGGLHLKGPLNTDALQATLDRIVARHEILRTTLREVDGHAEQIIAPAEQGLNLTTQDLRSLTAAEKQAAMEDAIRHEHSHPFDFAAEPLIRGQLLKLAGDEHVILLTQHHMVSDGWSLNILIHELTTLYAAFSQGQPDPLPALPVQYADYALWQRTGLQGERLEKQVNFWRHALHGAPALLELPTDRARPAVQSYQGDQVAFTLSPALSRDLKALGQRHGATLFMTLTTAWSVLLSRLSGQTDIVIGTPIANRQHSELEPLIGFFANTLALRIRLDDNPTVGALLAQVKAHAQAAYAHQDLPFEQLVEALQPPRSLSHSPIFQVMLALDNTPQQHVLELGELVLEALPSGRKNTHFDLSLSLNETPQGLAGELEYASDLFERASIERLAGYLQTLLAAMVDDDSRPVETLPLLQSHQRQQLLVDFNHTALPCPQDKLIHQLLEQQADCQPDAIALVWQDIQFSYAELNRRANQLAHYLIASGVRPDDRVAICADRSPDMIIGMYGILKAGAGYVPLDPEYPAERLMYQLTDSNPALLLTQSHLQDKLAIHAVPVFLLDDDTRRNTLARQPDHNPDAGQWGLQPHHLAYIIYTSGSTGQPKGVMLEHRNVVSFIHAQHHISAPQPGDRILQFATMAFDTSVSDIFPTLAAGATLVLRPPHLRVPDAAFVAYLTQQQITVIDLPTAFWHHWGQEMKAGRIGFSPHLRTLIVGGEKAEFRHLTEWQALPDTRACRWINTYGPTEATVIATHLTLDNRPYPVPGIVPIGRPNANTRIYILDPHGQPVPPGVSGEIHIGGAGVARGYLHQPALTAEKFIADPFSDQAGARMYKSGDLGRWLPDGNIDYLGRNDFQVKIRGFRIEPGEIEAQLAACDGVQDAVVVAREGDNGDKRLIAYLIPQPGAVLTPVRLREQLSACLMEHMLPGAFVMLAAFPLTASGKLDRRALPAPDSAALASHAYEAPQGEMEQVLAALWQSLLGLEQVGRHDNFFALGGHSLLTVQVAARLRQQHHLQVELQDLFTWPVLSELARALDANRSPAQPAIRPARRDQPLPLSSAQQRLWFLAQLDPAAQTAYHIAGGLRLKGPLNTDALQATLDRIVARHEILRTTLQLVDGHAEQIIAPADQGFNLTTQDLRPLAAAEKQAVMEDAIRHEHSHPFDFAAEPLIRGQLLKLAGDEHVILLTQHHMVSDGWSLNILIHELTTLYAAFSQGQPDPLPALPVQYADYALWQRTGLQGERLEKQVNFWRHALHGAPALLELPTDRVRPAVQSYQGDQVAFTLSPALSRDLKALGQRHGATLFMTLTAAWSVLLSRLSGQTDIVIGTPIANRQHSELEPLIGFFANTLALRIRLDDNPTVGALLAQVKAHAQAAYAHQDLPFEQLVEALQPPRSLSHSPIFQVMLALDNTPQRHALELGELVLDELPSSQKSTHFDLSLSLNETPQGLAGELEYASDLFERASIERLAGYLQTLLAAMVDDDSRPVETLPLLQSHQRHQLLVEFNAVDHRDAVEHSDIVLRDQHSMLIHQLFEQQVASTPDVTALVSGENQLSYAELNRRANQLAHYLIASGVGPDDRVAICADRSPDMIIGMYGILKAGAGYVPLDPEYPAERLIYQLTDSNPALLLTQSHLQDKLAIHAVPVFLLDDDTRRNTLGRQPDHNPDAGQLGLQPHHLAYIIYTSGSTGMPKGVMLEHRNVVSFIHAQHQTSEPKVGDRILQFATVAFDTSVSDIFPTLASGATLVLRPPHIRIPDITFVNFLRQQKITVIDLPTAFWHHWVQETMAGRSGFSPHLRTLIVGGEKAEYRHLMSWLSNPETQSCRWINSYGPTETTVIATTLKLDKKESVYFENSIPIGYPLPNSHIYILDKHGQPVPIGVNGEIHIGGAGVARGYLNRTDLTNEKFMADPFSDQAGARMYKTGDLGRWLPDGNIDYLGRNDFQVKIRGFRIEPGEIETQLAACEGVSDAVVIAREEETGNKQLVAYLIPQSGITLHPSDLREQLSSRLMEHMLPSAFVVLDAFPLSANGKLDRNALPAPDHSAIVSREYEAPQGKAEQQLAAVWQSLLGLEQAGRHDNFFELGGHSLLVVNLIEELRQTGLSLDVSAVFSSPTLAAMSARLNQNHAQDIGILTVPENLIREDSQIITPDMLPLAELTQEQIDRVVALVPEGVANIQDIYPLGPLQAGILFHHLLETEGDTYLDNQLMAFDSRARLDNFLRIFQQVIDRHDILRSAVHWQELPEPVQVVYRRASLPIKELTLSAEESADESAETQLRRLTDSRTVRMDITKAPLLEAHIARDPESGQWLLSLLHHHLVCDHLSLNMVFNEVKALFLGEEAHLPTPLPYRHFIAQIRSVPQEAHQEYFRHVLGDVDEPTLPFGLPDMHNDPHGADQPNEIAEDVIVLDDDLACHLRECAQQQGMSAAVLFHVAWAQVLSRCSGRDDVVFGTVLLGRLQGGIGASRVLGMFINTLPVRVRLQSRTVQQAVQETHQQLSELLDHEQAPLAVAQRCSGIQAPLPLFNSLLNFRHSPRDKTESASQVWEGVQILDGEERSNYPLSLDVDDFGDGFSLTAQCSQQVNPARLNAYMEIALKEIVSALQNVPEQPMGTIGILPPAERNQLLVSFNNTEQAYPQDALIHQLFEQQAARTPDITALVFGDSELSYAGLNLRANQLAHMLIAFGVRPDDRVALCVERSPEMVIAMLGILKAGANYVPLDPEYPTDRLTYQLSDSKPVLMLTQQHLQPRLSLQGIPVWLLDDDVFQDNTAQQPAHDPDARQLGIQPHHLAYIIYTSGSTGQPKGVMIEHRNVVGFIHAQHQISQPQAGDRILQFATMAFDTSVSDIFPTLTSGATLVLRPAHIRVPDTTFVDYLNQQKITLIDLPTAFWHHWVQEMKAGRTGFSPHLRAVIVGGEKAEFRHWADWQLLPETQHCRWINTYGPTETTVIATHLIMDSHSGADAVNGVIPIGYPNANTRIYILDPQGHPVPLGVSGEIHIGGMGVARGYLNRPDLTTEKFADDPFSQQPGARRYKTGDLGRWLADGTIEYLGRNDFQVKIRGFRIEPGEIEAQLLACPGVREALVITREENNGDKRLVAYVIPQPDVTLDANELREQLHAHLASYMIPNAFVMLASFPLTASGKVDRQSLPAPDHAAIASHEYKAPEGEIEQQIATIMQALLGLEKVGRHDSFFDLGGNSLSIIQLMARLRDEFHLEISISDIFAHSTLTELAELIASRQLETFFAQEDIESLQKELENLSEDELRALLNGDN